MICRDMKAIIKNVEHSESDDKYVVVKAVADDNMLWYYGRYATVDKGMEVARDITSDGIVGFVVIDEYYDIFAQMNAIKEYIKMAEDVIKEQADKYPNDLLREYSAKKTAFDYIRKVVNGE